MLNNRHNNNNNAAILCCCHKNDDIDSQTKDKELSAHPNDHEIALTVHSVRNHPKKCQLVMNE